MKKFLPIVLLTIISVFLIFYQFSSIPKYLAFDEVEFAKLSLSLQGKPYIPYSTLATGHSTLYFYILLTSLKTFGLNIFALRFPAAVFGILSVLMFYLVIKGLKNYAVPAGRQELRIANFNVLPFFASIIFLTSRWFLNFSRFSFEATFLLFLELSSIYFFIRTVLRVGGLSLILSGIFAGLAFLSYTPGRIFFLLPLGFLIFKSVNSLIRNNKINNLKTILYFLIPFVIVISPLTLYLSTNKDTRIDQQFFLRNSEMTTSQKLSGLWHNISSTALMFNIKGDVNGRHNYPNKDARNPILGILFIIGFIAAMKQWNNESNKLFLFFFFLSILPALMTYPWENPNMLRTYTVLPSVIYFIGSALIILDAAASKIISDKKIFVSCFLFLLILSSCLYELRTYFKYQSVVFGQSFEIKLPLEKAIKVKLKP